MADLDTFNQGEAQEEPGFLDKLTGVFASPGATFEAISNYPPRIKDWLVPLVITIIFALLSNFLIMKNAVLREQAIEMQMKAVRESLSEQVEKGILTQKQADQQLNRTSEFFESNSGSGMALQMIGTVFSMFIIFFIVSLFYFLVVKIGLKGTGTYTAAMTAYGLPYYIVALKLLMIILLSFATHRIFTNASIG